MNAQPGRRLYANAELGVRFEIDDSFADGPPLHRSPGLPGNVTSAYLAARRPGGEQAVLSISRVEVGYDTSPHELAEQLVIHNRYAAHTAEQNGWTIHSPWKATMLAGYPAMHCDYVVPGAGPAGETGSRRARLERRVELEQRVRLERRARLVLRRSWRPDPSRCWRPQAASRRCRDTCRPGLPTRAARPSR